MTGAALINAGGSRRSSLWWCLFPTLFAAVVFGCLASEWALLSTRLRRLEVASQFLDNRVAEVLYRHRDLDQAIKLHGKQAGQLQQSVESHSQQLEVQTKQIELQTRQSRERLVGIENAQGGLTNKVSDIEKALKDLDEMSRALREGLQQDVEDIAKAVQDGLEQAAQDAGDTRANLTATLQQRLAVIMERFSHTEQQLSQVMATQALYNSRVSALIETAKLAQQPAAAAAAMPTSTSTALPDSAAGSGTGASQHKAGARAAGARMQAQHKFKEQGSGGARDESGAGANGTIGAGDQQGTGASVVTGTAAEQGADASGVAEAGNQQGTGAKGIADAATHGEDDLQQLTQGAYDDLALDAGSRGGKGADAAIKSELGSNQQIAGAQPVVGSGGAAGDAATARGSRGGSVVASMTAGAGTDRKGAHPADASSGRLAGTGTRAASGTRQDVVGATDGIKGGDGF